MAKAERKAPVGFIGHADKAKLKIDWQTPGHLLDCVRDYWGGPIPFDGATAIDNPCGALEYCALPVCACGHSQEAHMFELFPRCQGPGCECEVLELVDELQPGLVNGGRHVALDGLEHDWPRRVWINPPYGRATRVWLPRIKVAAEERREMIGLLSCARWEQAYFMRMLAEANAVCFISGRVEFINPRTGDPVGGNTYANMFVGWGVNLRRFRRKFERVGQCFHLGAL